jgi:hypothetical protein
MMCAPGTHFRALPPHGDVIFLLEPDPMEIPRVYGLRMIGVRDPALNQCMRLNAKGLDDYEMVQTLTWVSDVFLPPLTQKEWRAIMRTVKQQAGWKRGGLPRRSA